MPLAFEQRMRPTTRRTLEASMRHRPPVTRDARPRQLPTVTSHAVPTGEYQSDPPSLPEAIRCSNARAPTAQAAPLDSLLHIRGLMWNWRACGDGPDQAAEFERPQFVLVAVRAAVDRAQMRRVWAASHRCGSFTSSLSLSRRTDGALVRSRNRAQPPVSN